MNQEDKKNPNNWTQEERDRVVEVFQWLLDQDRKQNPHLYTKSYSRVGSSKEPERAKMSLTGQ